eukprot:6203157-Pleurochrysis_carterae.AAC.2
MISLTNSTSNAGGGDCTLQMDDENTDPGFLIESINHAVQLRPVVSLLLSSAPAGIGWGGDAAARRSEVVCTLSPWLWTLQASGRTTKFKPFNNCIARVSYLELYLQSSYRGHSALTTTLP